MANDGGKKSSTLNDRPHTNGSLQHEATTAAFEDTVAPEENDPVDSDHDFPEVEKQSYVLGDEFARGGLGRILAAHDQRLGREVALKELISNSPKAETRFIREALITARLQHPNIVPIHEAGRWPSGERFYAMKMVEGKTLADAIDKATSQEERLALLPKVIDVADALAYAHSQGILHRDLKPSNVMVGPFGETIVIDWGLAKDVLDQTHSDSVPEPTATTGGVETSDGIVVGTPPYMSPEQAGAKRLDQRSDVYALGAMLYHVLSGRRPYDDVRKDKILQSVAAHPPIPLEDISNSVPPELITIVHKAMEREPDHRYPTAQEMAEELRRFSTGQLVGAHFYGPWDLAKRFVQRQLAAVVTATLAFLVLVSFGAWSFINITEQKDQAEQSAQLAEAQVDQLILEKARSLLAQDPTASAAWTKKLGRTIPGAATVAAEAQDRGVAQQILRGHEDVIDVVAFSPDGRLVASGSTDKTIRLWELDTRRVHVWRDHEDRVATLAFAPHGRSLASGSYDRTVRLWDLKTGKSRVIGTHDAAVKRLAFASDGNHLASIGEDQTVRIYDLAEERERTLSTGPVNRQLNLVFSPAGRMLVTGGHGATAKLWFLDEPELNRTLSGHENQITWVALSLDGKKIATAGTDQTVRIFDVASNSVQVLRGHDGVVNVVTFSPDGEQLASAGQGRTVRIWDLKNNTSRSLRGHSERIRLLAFSKDGRHLASGSWDKSVRLWNTKTGESRALLGHGDVISGLAFSPRGGTLVSASWDRTIRVWPIEDTRRRTLKGHQIGVHGVSFSPDHALVASGGHDNLVRVWELDHGTSRVFEGHRDHIYRVDFSPDGARIASSSDDRTVRLWNVLDGSHRVLEGHKADVEEIAFSKDGKWLASAGEDNVVWLWHVPTGGGQPLRGHTGHVTSIAFNSSGKKLASGSEDGTVRVWNTASGTSKVLQGHAGEVWGVDFAPDGREVASASLDGTVRSWNALTGEERYTYTGITGARLVRYSPEGRWIAIATAKEQIWLCQRGVESCAPLLGHEAAVWDLEFASEGALVSGSSDTTVRLWDVETKEHRVLRGHAAPVFDVAVSNDGQWIASASGDTTVRVWPVDLPPKPQNLPGWLTRLTFATTDD